MLGRLASGTVASAFQRDAVVNARHLYEVQNQRMRDALVLIVQVVFEARLLRTLQEGVVIFRELTYVAGGFAAPRRTERPEDRAAREADRDLVIRQPVVFLL